MPELRHLRVLLAVAEERNFTRAAERLHLAQPAVSRAIAQLERELGVELLERTTREVHLTTAGTALTERAAAIVADADAAFALVRAHGRGLAGEIEIGVTPAVGPATQADVARRLREDAPELSVRFQPCARARWGATCASGASRSCCRARRRARRRSTWPSWRPRRPS